MTILAILYLISAAAMCTFLAFAAASRTRYDARSFDPTPGTPGADPAAPVAELQERLEALEERADFQRTVSLRLRVELRNSLALVRQREAELIKKLAKVEAARHEQTERRTQEIASLNNELRRALAATRAESEAFLEATADSEVLDDMPHDVVNG